MPSYYVFGTAALAVFVATRIINYTIAVKKLSYLPGMRSLFSPVSLFGALLPTSRFNPGLSWQWQWRNKVYQHHGAETISAIPYISGRASLYTSSIEVARQVVSTKGQFEKPVDTSQITLLWGKNLFAANGAEWRRHRRIMSPAFSSETYALVWEETALTYREMMADEGWDNLDVLTVPAINHFTTKLALIVISRCGFGNHLPWKWPTKTNSDAMTFAEALAIVSDSSIIRLVTPRWLYKLPIKRLHTIDTAYRTLADFMSNLISKQRAEMIADGGKEIQARRDVFSLMIRASETEGKLAMSDEELCGNTFLMLFAGHETTAHTLDATIGFLALYEDIQEEVYMQVKEVAPGKTPPLYTDLGSLHKVQASFLEAARLFPAGFMMIRDAAEDVFLTTHGEGGVTGQVALERGTRVAVDVVGMNYNPRHFPEPEEFRPSRWYCANENDLSMFSFGSRACIGRKFATTEAVCFLTLLLQEWRLEIILNAGESRQQWRERVMKGMTTMSLGVGKVPVRLVRRG